MDADKRARLRDEQDRETFAIRRLEREMAEDEPTLEHRLDDLESDIEHAEETVDRDLRAQGFRHVEHPPFWRAGSPEGTVAREPGRDSRDGPATYRIGAGVRCADGPCGELGRVVIDPARRAVTHLVIAPHHREALGRLVRVAMADLDASGITLETTEARMADLPYAHETEFLPSDPWVSAGPPTAGVDLEQLAPGR